MGIQIKIPAPKTTNSDELYCKLFKAEIAHEIDFIKQRLSELERRLEDPYG